MIDQEQVIDLYEAGYTMFEIADKFNVEEAVIRNILRDYLTEEYEHDREQ